MKNRILVLPFALALAAVGSATVTGTSNVSATCFNNLSGNLPNKRITNNNLVISWGSRSDCLYFTPTSFNGALNSPFKVGQLCWVNSKSRYEVAGSLNATLNVGIRFSNPNLGTKVFRFDVGHTDGAGYAQDSTSLPTSFAPQTMTVGNTLYTIRLIGFKPNSGASNVSNWQIAEGTSSCLNLYAQVDAQPVPEPATLAILGVGGAALLRRRRK